MTHTPIKRHSLGDDVYKRLLRDLLDGRHAPGSPLREEQLSEAFGVSRTPVREALIRLEREGILERRHACGFLVRELPESDLDALFQARSLCECMILRNWFNSLDRTTLAHLRQRLADVQLADPQPARRLLLTIDEAMHDAILAACPNPFLADQLRRLILLCRPYRLLRCADAVDLTAILAERRHILDAMLSADVDAAVRCLADHLEQSRRFFRTPSPTPSPPSPAPA